MPIEEYETLKTDFSPSNDRLLKIINSVKDLEIKAKSQQIILDRIKAIVTDPMSDYLAVREIKKLLK
jgi:hypothetical protein